MGVEVEMKFPLADPAELATRLKQWGCFTGETPAGRLRRAHQDFATTDEALRLRSEGIKTLSHKDQSKRLDEDSGQVKRRSPPSRLPMA